jgi:hypothetical protein
LAQVKEVERAMLSPKNFLDQVLSKLFLIGKN